METPRWRQQDLAVAAARIAMCEGDNEKTRAALEKLRALLPTTCRVHVINDVDPGLVTFIDVQYQKYLPHSLLLCSDYVEVQGDVGNGWKAKVVKTRLPTPHLPVLLARASDVHKDFGPAEVL